MAPTVSPLPPLGLSQAEAEQRLRQGQGNTVDIKTSRSLSEIILGNLLQIANVVLLVIMGVLFLVGKPAEALSTGGVVFVNIFLGAFQEFRAKRKLDQIALLNRPRVTVIRDGREQVISQSEVVVGDALVLRAGDQAVVDGQRVAVPGREHTRLEMDESLLTGESDLIRKQPGDEIFSGSFCVIGEGVYIAEKVGNESFAQKITAGAREFTRVVTPLQAQISILVRVLVVAALGFSLLVALQYAYAERDFAEAIEDMAVIIALVPQGLLLMITVAYALGALRIAQKGALVQQSNAVESLSNVDVLCLDKTGTLTTNRILFHALHPLNGTETEGLQARLANYIASTGAKNRTAEALAEVFQGQASTPVAEIPFSSARKWAGASFEGNGTYIFGAPEMIAPALGPAETDLSRRSRASWHTVACACCCLPTRPMWCARCPKPTNPPCPATCVAWAWSALRTNCAPMCGPCWISFGAGAFGSGSSPAITRTRSRHWPIKRASRQKPTVPSPENNSKA
ncbi:MAG: HAD-IC family P-type ATPase [Anaerolineae bacterium]|nr:HAD-IC family P-type ATPase [Anaerolineae bacterium]